MAIGMPHSETASIDPAEDGGGAIFAEINITPLTDVILVLMIILMFYAAAAVTQMQRREQRALNAQRSGLKINLPDGAAKEIEPGAASLVVGITASGDVFVNGQPVAESDLPTVFQNAFGKDRETQVVIQADGEAAHRRVVDVMEKAKSAGLRKIAIATRAGN
ncbi:MAG: biopolymer transporter ExbD [Deltaproteobacteria bacterium]|nr:MAG: biopolymer transporter ExbD [Deltaproteobacteria bacterium]